MILKPYKQTTCESCLPVCLLSLSGQKLSAKAEVELLIGGLKGNRESYAFGIVSEFALKYKKKVTVFVDNKTYLKTLDSSNNNSRVILVHKKIDSKFLLSLETPFVLFLDENVLGEYVHCPHFVIVEKRKDKNFLIIDPWEGKRRRLNEAKLMKGVVSLRNHLKFCPFVIKLN